MLDTYLYIKSSGVKISKKSMTSYPLINVTYFAFKNFYISATLIAVIYQRRKKNTL